MIMDKSRSINLMPFKYSIKKKWSTKIFLYELNILFWYDIQPHLYFFRQYVKCMDKIQN